MDQQTILLAFFFDIGCRTFDRNRKPDCTHCQTHQYKIPVFLSGIISRGDDLCVIHGNDAYCQSRIDYRFRGIKMGMFYLLIAFFGGIALIALIDFLVPESGNPHEIHGVEEMNKRDALHRAGLVVAFSLALHNFPEGIATFTSALEGLDIAIPITVAIAIHNIPEGIAVSVPIYHATGNRKKGFLVFFPVGIGRTCRCRHRISVPDALLDNNGQWDYSGRSFRHYGIYFTGRIITVRRKNTANTIFPFPVWWQGWR